ncbi:hypothetical protein KCU92_g10164, partial [Aureobasidium melanogenum]
MAPPTKDTEPALPMEPSTLSDVSMAFASPPSTQSNPHVSFILNLPSEILLNIISLCEDGDLSKLRMVNKSLCNHATETFASVRFAHLRHHLTEKSLEDLISITSNDTFATHVKSIELSTARSTRTPPWSYQELSEFSLKMNEKGDYLRSGSHIRLLSQAMLNLKRHNRLEVVLGVFDSSRNTSVIQKINSPQGHGYLDAFGGRSHTGIAPQSTMYAIAQAAKNANYPLSRLSMYARDCSHTIRDLLLSDRARVLYVDDYDPEDDESYRVKSNRVESGLSLTIARHTRDSREPIMTTQVSTHSHSRLATEGKTMYLNPRQQRFHIARCLEGLNHLANGTSYHEVVLKNLALYWDGVDEILSWKFDETLELLELSEIVIGDDDLYLDTGEGHNAKKFLERFRDQGTKIKSLKISNFIATRDGDKLELAGEEVVAQGREEVQSTFNDMIARIENW